MKRDFVMGQTAGVGPLTRSGRSAVIPSRAVLNGRQPRSIREAARDPFDWFEAPPQRPRRPAARQRSGLLAGWITALFAAYLVAVYFGCLP